jgi:hypothetical protein
MASKSLIRQAQRFLQPSQTGVQVFEGLASTQVKRCFTKNAEGKFACTMIPGDGVGPELASILTVCVPVY